jgi:putative Mn2+ efflux pump MntP
MSMVAPNPAAAVSIGSFSASMASANEFVQFIAGVIAILAGVIAIVNGLKNRK